MKKKNDIYDAAMDYIFTVLISIGRNTLKYCFKFIKSTLLNSLQFKRILNTKIVLMIYCLIVIISCSVIWMLDLHPVYYILSIFVYFGFYTFVMDVKQFKKRSKIKLLNKKYKKIRELFDNKIDILSVKKDIITIFSNELTVNDINSKFNKLELFFNRKISTIERQAKNLRYVDINFMTKTSFKAKYYFEQYIEYVKIPKKFNLPFILGIDEKENIYVQDLSRLNHVFVSGESDFGKSVLLNCIIQSLMTFRNYIEFMLVDLKEGIEMSDYINFPNCLIVSNIKEFINIIEYLERIMIERLQKIKNTPKCKNILQYNKLSAEKMNFVVLIIDEFATIKLNGNSGDIETRLLSILQKGRAAGIYVIGATQRPSSTQMSTDIRAGFLYNISLRVTTKETQRMTKIYGTENLKKGEFKSDIVRDVVLKSFFIDENLNNGVYENLSHLLVNKKEFIFIKDKEPKKLSFYKRLCKYVTAKLYKERTIDYMNHIDYRQLIKVPEQKIITEIEHIKQLYGFDQNNPQNDSFICSDNYSKFLEYIFRNNKESGLLPDSKNIEGDLNLTRHERLKLQGRAIEDGYIEKAGKTRCRIIPNSWKGAE